MNKTPKDLMEEIKNKMEALKAIQETKIELGGEYDKDKEKIDVESMNREEEKNKIEDEEESQDEKIEALQKQIDSLKDKLDTQAEIDDTTGETEDPGEAESEEDDEADEDESEEKIEESTESEVSYHDKDKWFADAKKMKYDISFWGHGSVDAYDMNGKRVGTWKSEHDTHNSESKGGTLIVKSGGRVSKKTESELGGMFTDEELSEDAKVLLMSQFNESVNRKVAEIKTKLEYKYKKEAKLAKKRVLEEARVVDGYAKYLNENRRQNEIKANANLHREIIKESLYKAKINSLKEAIVENQRSPKRETPRAKINLQTLKEGARRHNKFGSVVDERVAIESRKSEYLSNLRDSVINESAIVSEFDYFSNEEYKPPVTEDIKGIVNFFDNQM